MDYPTTTADSPASRQAPLPNQVAPSGKPEGTCEFEVREWEDPVMATIGVDPLDPYVEKYWSGILGPSATLLLRRLTTELRASPGGFRVTSDQLAGELGIAMRNGKHGPFWRALYRAERFGVLQRHDYVVLVRTRVAPLSSRQVERLPEHLRRDHVRYTAIRRPPEQKTTRPIPTHPVIGASRPAPDVN